MPPDDLENLLQRYHPVGPPPTLREKVLAPTAAQRRWPLYCFRAAIAATLLFSAGLLHAADTLNGTTAAHIGAGPIQWSPEAQTAADMLGPEGPHYIALCLLDRP